MFSIDINYLYRILDFLNHKHFLMNFWNIFFLLAILFPFPIKNASTVYYVNQLTNCDPTISDGSSNFPFSNISSAIIKYPNVSNFDFILVNTNSPYDFPIILPDISQIIIEALTYCIIFLLNVFNLLFQEFSKARNSI